MAEISLTNIQCVPTVIDVEASGFGSQSYPIELGVSLSCGRRFSMLIRPEPSWTHWDATAQSVHGLTREVLFSTGKSVEEVAETFNTLLTGKTAYSDGWVVDKPWVSLLYHTARVPMMFSVSPIEQIMSEAQFEIWDDAKSEVIKDLQANRHRASQDAWIIQQTYSRTQYQCDKSAKCALVG